MGRRPINTWDEYLVVGNTGGEGGHDIRQKNPNYKPGSMKAGQTKLTQGQKKSQVSHASYDASRWDARSKAGGVGGQSFDLSGKGRWRSRYAKTSNFETNATRIGQRKAAVEADLYKGNLKSWAGNEWMKKALNQAWDTDYKGYRSTHLSRTASKWVTSNTGGEGGHDTSSIKEGGYGGWSKQGAYDFSYEMVNLAQEIKSGEERDAETDKRKDQAMGGRQKTMLTGHAGILGRARTRRQTLMGREDRETGVGGKAKGTRG